MRESQRSEGTRPTLIEICTVALLCAVFLALVISFVISASATEDEMVHLAGGCSYLKWHDYRISPSHPPLAKKLAALPSLTQHVWPEKIELRPEDSSSSTFFDSGRMARVFWAMALKYPNAEWNFSHQLLYGVREETQQRFGVETPLLIPSTAALTDADFHNQTGRLLFLGRLMISLLSIVLAVLIYLWARELHGRAAAGILALTLFVFDPNFIAHSGLVTTDVALVLFLSGAMYFYWRLCQCLTVTSVALFLICFALAFVTKFSAVLLIPIFWLVAMGRIFSGDNWTAALPKERLLTSSKAKTVALLAIFSAAALVTWVTVWAVYDFRYSAASNPEEAAQSEKQVENVIPVAAPVPFRQPGHFPVELEVRRTAAIRLLLKKSPQGDFSEQLITETMMAVPIGLDEQLLLFVNRHRLLPEAYLQGFASLRAAALLAPSYLRGAYSQVGFRTYFLWAFLLKTPLPTMVVVFAGIVLAITRKMSWSRDLAFLVVPAVVYLGFSIPAHINYGYRHILPIYPFLFVLAGLLAKEIAHTSRPVVRRCVYAAGLTAIAVSSSFSFYPPWRPQVVFPHYLAYFNELAGGPLNGWRSLVDSNIDWGQDLKGLKTWLDRAHLEKPIYFCYFGTADPRYYGIVHQPVPNALGGYAPTSHGSNPDEATKEFLGALQTGDHIAISVQALVGPRLSPPARQVWKEILNRSTLVDRIGYSIFVFRLDAQP
jgi:Dolichyl-phosphate-mannose-protein mannosyltransferase